MIDLYYVPVPSGKVLTGRLGAWLGQVPFESLIVARRVAKALGSLVEIYEQEEDEILLATIRRYQPAWLEWCASQEGA